MKNEEKNMKIIRELKLLFALWFLCITFNQSMASLNNDQGDLKKTPLPFDFRLWDKAERSVSNEGYFFDHSKVDYEFTDNIKLFTYLVSDNPFLSKYYKENNQNIKSAIYVILENKKNFDTYIIKISNDFILLNVSKKGEILSVQKIATTLSSNQWRTFVIDESLKIRTTEEIVRYSEVNSMYLRNRKLFEQIYQILDDGKIKLVSNKQFPNIKTNYNPAIPDNCFQKIASFSNERIESDSPLDLPISSADFNYISDNFETEGKGGETYCQTLAGNYARLPNVGQNYVYFFTGRDDIGWVKQEQSINYNGIGYLVTIRNHEVKDMLPIYYNYQSSDQKIEFIINKNMNIDLLMTSNSGEKLKQSFHINQNGEFE